ncbi:MAG: T9SS type A sorting domain-containing protein [Bacteroidetes bacterium]|nr:T9SS type A sorting domain-containing protein [Bacteroidota bacterium]
MYDQTGRLVVTEQQLASNGMLSISLRGLSKGIYYIRAVNKASGEAAAAKLIIAE